MTDLPARNQSCRVLHVGPDRTRGRRLKEALQQTTHHCLAWEVCPQPDPQTARSAIEAGLADAVVLRAAQHEPTLRAVEMLTEASPAVPVVVLDDRDRPDLAREAVHAGAVDVLGSDSLDNGTLARILAVACRSAPSSAIGHSEPSFAHLVQANSDAMLVVDHQGLIRFANPAAETLFAREVDLLIGREFGFPVLSQETSEIEIVRPGRPLATAEMRSVGIDWNGREAFLVTLRDVTHIRATEHDLRRATKMEAIGRLTAGVAHYCNNKLAVIRGFSDLLLSRTPETDERRNQLEQLRNATKQLSRLINHLLSFGRRQILNPRRIAPNKVIHKLHDGMTSLLGMQIELTLELADDAWDIDVDATLLEEALFNVISNAADAMPEGGSVTLRTSNTTVSTEDARTSIERLPGRYLLIEVQDTGEGMDTGTLERIFEPFFTTRELHAGRGLGLAMVHGFVSQSGGFVEADSLPTRGTTVRLFIPQGFGPEPSGDDPRSRQLVKAADTKATLLVAESNAAIRTFVAHTLRSRGYHVLEAANGLQALLQSESYTASLDLLVADVVMPAMNGATIASRIQRLRPGVSVLYLSPFSERILHREQLISPSAKLLTKPFGAKQLIEAVEGALGNGR
jgi:signal transduction histidine kinase/ActR/RegA family two-component response regulator